MGMHAATPHAAAEHEATQRAEIASKLAVCCLTLFGACYPATWFHQHAHPPNQTMTLQGMNSSQLRPTAAPSNAMSHVEAS